MHTFRQFVVEMGDREDNVYKAKLTEQAERYDGKWQKTSHVGVEHYCGHNWMTVAKRLQ